MKQICPIKKIIKRDGSIVKYNRSRISTAILKATASTGKPNPKIAESMSEKVEAALVAAYSAGTIPSVEDIQDVVENVLMDSRLTRIARNYIIYRHQRAMARAARAYQFEVTDNVPYKKIYEVLRWNTDHGCDSVPALNKIIKGGKFPDLVKEADRRYKDEINLAAVKILEDLKNIRIAIVAGPSSSGKTTATIKLSERLKTAGVHLKAINIDHYFYDLEFHPKDEFGDYDYETPEALDLKLINEHLELLLAGKTVLTPHYNFKTGKRRLNAHELTLKKNEILLIDSLHGLYEGMTQNVAAKNKFRLYIETLGQFKGADGTLMRWSDNRLLRRMIRDMNHRNLKPMQTLTHWHYVRRSEIQNIIPFIKHTDCIINSALPYELPILKSKLFRYISPATNKYKDDPKRLDAHIRANRIYELLKPLKTVKNDSCVPSDSLLREFIGGSRYRY
ncbi:ATP cone domain-containing protein [Verrucomicrobiota bacterium]